MRHWWITRNSNVAIKTGSAYISYSMIDISAISTTNLRFSTTPSAKKLTPGDCDDDRQPEMAMWPPKPDILISLELWQTGWQFQWQIWSFRPLPVRRNWPPAMKLTPCDCNNNLQLELPYGRFACQSRNFWQSVVVAMIWLIICWARHHRKSLIWRGNLDAICFSSRDVIISGFGGHIDISGCRSVFCLLANIISPVRGLIPQCRWNFNRIVCSLTDVFPVSVAIFYCSSLLQSPGYTSCDFAMVECRRFAVGIFMTCVIVLEILLLPVTWLPCWILDTK